MIVVTGATGVIPQSAAEELAKLGHPVRVLARDPGKVASGVAAVAGDLDRPGTLPAAFAGADAIVLVTGAGPELVARHRAALAAAQEAGVKKIVRVSAWGAAKDSPAALGRWHGELDAAFREAGPTYVSIQPHGFMQNTFGYAGTVKSAGAIYAPLGAGRVCYVDARDIGAVAGRAAAASRWDDQALELTGPAAFSYEELATTLGEVLGKPVRYTNVTAEAAREAMLADAWPAWLVDDLLILSRFYAEGAASRPTTTVAEVLGRPARSLRAFLAEHRAVFGG